MEKAYLLNYILSVSETYCIDKKQHFNKKNYAAFPII